MGKYEVCWPMGRVPTGRAPHQLTESPFKYLKDMLMGIPKSDLIGVTKVLLCQFLEAIRLTVVK